MSATKQRLSEAESLARDNAKDPYFKGESVYESFVRTIIWNRSSYSSEHRPSAAQCFNDYNAVKSFYTMSETILPMLQSLPQRTRLPDVPLWDQYRGIGSQANRFLHFGGSSFGMKFCVTDQGRMAIVPPLSYEGDIICVIKGSRMPYVLRDKFYGERMLHNLVGSCYVLWGHGRGDP